MAEGETKRPNPAEVLAGSSITPEATTEPSPASPSMGAEVAGAESEAIATLSTGGSNAGAARWSAGSLNYTRAGLLVLFLLLLGGDFALSIRDRSIGAPIQYMFKRLHASDTLNAVTFAVLPPLLSLIIGPVVSFKSDRLRSRWGRRIPYLLIPAPFAAVAMVVISYSEPMGTALSGVLTGHADGASAENFALLLFTTAWTVFEVAAITATSVLGGLINDVVPRPLLGRFYGLFRAVSLGAAMIFNKFLIGYSKTHYRTIFISLAIIFLVGFTMMCLGVKEGEYPPPEPVDPTDSAGRRFLKALRTYMRECFNVPYYLWAFGAMALAACAFQPVNLFTVPYADQLGVAPDTLGNWLFLTYAASFVLAWPLGWLVDRAHALRVSMFVMAAYAVSMLVGYGFVRDYSSFRNVLIIHGVMSGTFFTTSSPLAQALFPRMKFAQFASAAGLVQSLLTIVLGLALGRLLDITHHNYRLTFIISGVFAALAFLGLGVVYAHFKRLGGVAGYVPPEPGSMPRGFEANPPAESSSHGH